MHYKVQRDKNLCGTNLCDWHLTRIIRMNKTRAEKCRFTVIWGRIHTGVCPYNLLVVTAIPQCKLLNIVCSRSRGS